MRVIVVGGGEIGFAIAQSLSTSDFEVFVIDHLPVEQVERVGAGLFHSRSEEPLDRDQLASRLPGPSLWLPQDLLARLRREKNVWNLFVDPAPSTPPGLGPHR